MKKLFIFLLLLMFPLLVQGATKYARNVTANWNVDSTWSTTGSGGAADSTVPTANDDVVFDSGFTGSITLTASTTVNSVVCATGAAGTLTHNTSVTLTIDSQDGSGNSLLLVSTMTYTPVDTALIAFTGAGTSKITTGGLALNRIGFSNAGDTFQLQDDLTLSYSSLTINVFNQALGTFDPNGHIVTFTGANSYITGTETITFYNLTKTGTVSKSNSLILGTNVTVTNTLNIDGNSSINRVLIQSLTLGTQVTLTLTGATISGCSNVDFRDITFVNSPGGTPTAIDFSGITGGSGDCGGNTQTGSAPIFTTADDWYWNGSGTQNFSDYTYWYTATNGGGTQMASTRPPLPQDTCYFDADSIDGATTVDQDMPRIPGIDFTGVDAMAFHMNNISQNIYGSWIVSSNVSITAGISTNTITFSGRGSHVLDYGGVYNGTSTSIQAVTGTYTLTSDLLQSNSISNLTFTLSSGTLDADAYNLRLASFISPAGYSRTLLMGSGTWYLYRNHANGHAWSVSATNFTSTNVGETSTIVIMTTAEYTGTNYGFDGGGFTYNNITLNASTDAAITNFLGSNIFNIFTINAPRAAKFTAGTTQQINSFVVVNDAANVVNIDSTSAGTHYTLNDANGGTNENDYLSVTDCEGTPANTWYYGANGDADAYSLANGWAAAPGGAATPAHVNQVIWFF